MIRDDAHRTAMVLFFRFVLVMLLSRFRRRIGPLDEATVRFTVLPNDCDLNVHLNAGRFISFMDVARVELLGRMRMFRPILRRGWRPINGGMTIRYRRSLLPFQRFAVRSRILGWDEKWLYFQHIVERNGQLCAIGQGRGLFRGPGGNVPMAELLAAFGQPFEESPELPEVVRRWRDAEDAR
jgi:acyl-CoA thioesterase FadM